MSNNKPGSYIFLCSNATEKECLDRMLFGGTMKYRPKTQNIQAGDTLFLYNYHSGLLHGKFKAVSQCSENIVPEAWGGKYPWQVKVERVENYSPISKTDIENIINFKVGDYLPIILNSDFTQAIENIFRSDERLEHLENVFRHKIPNKFVTTDGHRVKSDAEVIIDNWLFNNRIVHGYEKKVPVDEGKQMYCDFFIICAHTNVIVYIEYWGMSDEDYLNRKKEKLEQYKKYNLKLIEINPGDLQALDDILFQKLRSYL